METTPDRLRAVSLSLGLHALVLAVLYYGWMLQPELRDADAEGPAIEATLVSAPRQGAAAAARQEAHAQPKPQPPTPQPPAPQPQEQPLPRQLQSQTQLPKPDAIDQDEIRRDAQLAAEQQQKEQEERRRQAQVDLDRKQEQLQAESRQRQAQQDLDKQLAAIRQARADAERQAKLAQEKIKQDEDLKKTLGQNVAPATQTARPPPPGNNGDSSDLANRYKDLIKAIVHQNWHPQHVTSGMHCRTHYKQLPGGEVFDVSFDDNCPYDAVARASVEDALKRSPLPYKGFESVFQREGTIDMCDPEDSCQ